MNEVEARWQIHAAGYDRSGPVIVPDYHEMHQVLVGLAGSIPHSPVAETGVRILDLGAGAGRLLERLLERFPSAQVVWFDNAEMMQHRARSRLARFGDRTSYLLGNFRQPGWQAGLEGPFAAIVSSHALHHATDDEKRRLYGDIFALLQPGGLFLNADEVRAQEQGEHERRLRAWNAHVTERIAAGEVDEVMIKLWESWQKRILDDPWGQQTEFWNTPAQHLQWLHEAGFINEQCWWERGLWAIYGAQKPYQVRQDI